MADPVSTLAIPLVVGLVGILLLCVLQFSSYHRTSKSGAQPPKGSLGWPVFGETLDFIRDPPKYASSHYKRYGSIFKSSLFLQKAILGTTPEFARFVTSNRELFNIVALPTPRKIAPRGFAFKIGPEHLSIKKILVKAILPEALQTQVEVFDTILLRHFASWEQIGKVDNAKDATQKIMLDMGAYLLFGIPNIGSRPEGEMVLESLSLLARSLFAFPLNLPGTACNKALKAKANLASYVTSLIKERRGQEDTGNDMLGALIAASKDPNAREGVKDMDDASLLDNLLGMWFGFFESMSTTLVWLLKNLGDNPDVFQHVQAEQQEIRKSKSPSVDGANLSWQDTKKMAYSQKFFKEVQRTLSLGFFVIRVAAQDIEYKGQLIPKGWQVVPMYNTIHFDPTIHADPTTFNPDRFDATPKPYTYLPFSSGVHMCPGMEVAKLLSLIFIHHLTTTYTFERADVDRGKEYRPFPVPVGGYPINFRRRT